MAATMTTSEFVNAVDLGVRKHFVDELKAKKPMIDKVLRVEDGNDAAELEQSYAGMTQLPTVTEGSAYEIDAPQETYQTTYNFVKKGKATALTFETTHFDKSGVAKESGRLGDMHSKAVRRTIEKEAADLFNNGFDTGTTSYGDLKPLFSTDHTRVDGNSSVSNADTNGITLTHDNLETLIVQQRETVDDRGELVELQPNCLLVPPALEQEALVITKSTNRSGTGDNDVNTYKMRDYYGGQLKVVAWDYLTSSTAWFILDKENHQVKWKWHVKPQIADRDESTGFLNDQVYFKSRFLFAKGWSDFRGVNGSKGDGAAYTS